MQQGIGLSGQQILDIGTGTGVLPRALYPYGARLTGVDLSENQIEQARFLAQRANMKIDFFCGAAEEFDLPHTTFDVVTACQCFTYFNHAVLAPRLSKLLKRGGRFVVLYMAWLPHEDAIAAQSENLILQYNPAWNGCGETRRAISVPAAYNPYFDLEKSDLFDVRVPFRRDTWNGRIRACRGIGASLPDAQVAQFTRAHGELLEKIAPEEFEILHYVAAAILRKK